MAKNAIFSIVQKFTDALTNAHLIRNKGDPYLDGRPQFFLLPSMLVRL
jgi:hypothetical protein